MGTEHNVTIYLPWSDRMDVGYALGLDSTKVPNSFVLWTICEHGNTEPKMYIPLRSKSCCYRSIDHALLVFA